MAVEALLGRPVVIGGDDERHVGAEALRDLRQLDGLLGAVGPRSRDDGHLVAHPFDGQRDHPFVLLVGEGGGLARGAAGDDAVYPFPHLKFQEVFSASSSTAPSLKGVTSAVYVPRSFMQLLQSECLVASSHAPRTGFFASRAPRARASPRRSPARSLPGRHPR